MPDVASADAPGRVNLIGEHTDYHEGFVLPTILLQRTRVTLTRRPDRRVRACTAARERQWQEFELGNETPGRGWIDYVQGVTAMLARDGVPLSGFDATIESDVPIGAGVASSAALEVSLLRALRLLLHIELDDVRVAKTARAAETDFVGAPVGVMDQIAASLGRDGEALFLDTRTLSIERIPIPSSVELVVIDSAIPHAHAGGEYATRRRESFEAAALLGVGHLRDVDLAALDRLQTLPPILSRRVRHIVTENQRVLDATRALRAGDAVGLGELFRASHRSMRDDYETSTPELDTLVGIADAHPDVYGARLTGGGFGGSIVALTRAGRGATAGPEIRDVYRAATGRDGVVLVPASRDAS